MPARGRGRRRPAGKARALPPAGGNVCGPGFAKQNRGRFKADKDAAENQPLFAVEELRGLSVFTYPAQ